MIVRFIDKPEERKVVYLVTVKMEVYDAEELFRICTAMSNQPLRDLITPRNLCMYEERIANRIQIDAQERTKQYLQMEKGH